MLNEKELIDAFNDEEFVKKIFELKSKEEVQNTFKTEKGIELSLEQAEAIQSMIKTITEKVQNGEITKDDIEKMKNGDVSEEDLEKVVGGKSVAGKKAALSAFFVLAPTVLLTFFGTIIGCASAQARAIELENSWRRQ